MTVNLSPADIKKEGSAFDLAIAMALMAAGKPERFEGLGETMLLGELSLQGNLVPVRGALGMAITAAENGVKNLILPSQNALECTCIDHISIFPAQNLKEVYAHLTGEKPLSPCQTRSYDQLIAQRPITHDLKYVKGQAIARKALEIAAAGGHNLLMVGIPGSGKTMLARCLPGILPPMTYEESLQTTLIHSVPAMIGGGNRARPGEVSLANNGVLFLDELPEFQRATLEALRQPLEDGFVNVTRISGQNSYQSQCMLVAGMNPCPCGNLGSRTKECTCSPYEIKRYLARISGPLLDRIDIQVEMDAVSLDEIENLEEQEDSLTVRSRVLAARKKQLERYSGLSYRCNAHLDQKGLETFCKLGPDAKKLLHQAVERFHISMRTYGRIRKVARTIADLANHEQIEPVDIAQAIQFRNVDGRYWR